MGTAIIEAISSIFGLIPDIFSEVSKVFWTPAAEGTGGSLTFVGTVTLIGVGLALIIWGFSLIRGFMHLRG